MNELKLTDKEWKGFLIGNLFDVKIGKSIDGNKVNREQGYYAYITRKEQNNGLDGFIDYDEAYLNTDYPVITIGNETAEPFVQNYPFFTGTKVNILKAKQTLSREVLSFIVSSLKQHKSKYSYSFTINSTRLRKQVVMLPVNGKNAPDWQFMEDFIKQKEQKQIDEITDYYASQAFSLMIDTGNLKGTNWKEFFISDYFDFIRGNQSNMAKCQTGKIPLVSAKKVDNGYKDFIEYNGKSLFSSHIITLNNDGDGGVGMAYYQPAECALDTHVTALLPKLELSKFTMLFIACSITNQRDKFSHGYSINNNRLKFQKIMLPVNKDNLPDWQLMADFMQKIEQDKIKTVLAYYNSTKNERGGVTRLADNVKWQTFVIEDICEIYSGVRLIKQDMQEGIIPFIGASDSHNGVTAFVANSNASLDKNVLGVNYNGSVVESFYHPYECLFSDDVKRLKIKDCSVGKHAYLFLKMAILQQKSKYQYGYKFNAKRMAKQKILLPVNSDNSPNWAFMENYMKQIELEKIQVILKYYQ
ncbi:restriction endonuclease subunit S [Lonepinella sp. BR2357]|uniref:restriction endonuclease subunit S n=1 Tax=Lonepinella sp. BR2357 TaxID=3434549 RepID=UPI003F6DAB2E